MSKKIFSFSPGLSKVSEERCLSLTMLLLFFSSIHCIVIYYSFPILSASFSIAFHPVVHIKVYLNVFTGQFSKLKTVSMKMKSLFAKLEIFLFSHSSLVVSYFSYTLGQH